MTYEDTELTTALLRDIQVLCFFQALASRPDPAPREGDALRSKLVGYSKKDCWQIITTMAAWTGTPNKLGIFKIA